MNTVFFLPPYKKMDDLSFEEFKNMMRLMKRKLECPVCYDTILPPVSQCENGHAVCCTCRPKLTLCPVCKGYFLSLKNRFLDDILSVLPHKCIHVGCDEVVKAESDHEQWCGFQETPCEICELMMPANSLLDHLKIKHKNIEHFTNETTVSYMSIDEMKENLVLYPFYLHDQFFWMYVMYMDKDEEKIFKVVFKLIPLRKLTYSIEIKMEFMNLKQYYAAGVTITPDSALSEDENDNCFTLHESVLGNFITDRNELPYKLCAIKNRF